MKVSRQRIQKLKRFCQQRQQNPLRLPHAGSNGELEGIFLSIESISDLVFSRNRPILRQRPILTWYGRGEHWIGVGRGEHGK